MQKSDTFCIENSKGWSKMAKKYVVELSEEERAYLKEYIRKGKASGFRLKHAEILLKLDAIPENKEWTYEKIGKAHSRKREAVGDIAKRFVEEGLEAALCRKPQENRARKIDGKVEAHIITLACSTPPEGHERWTMQLLADEIVRLEILDSISDSAVCDLLKKTSLSLGSKKNGAYPKREWNL